MGWPGYGPPPKRSRTGLAVALTVVVSLLVVGGLVAAGVVAGVIRVPSDTSVPPAAPRPAAAEPEAPPEPPPVTAAPSPEAEVEPPSGPADFAGTYAGVSSGVALLEVAGCDASGTGTGFLVAEDQVATAAHVVDQATDITVSFDEQTVQATVQGVDESADLALLQLSEPVAGHVFEFALSDPTPGTRVAALGFPLDQPKTLTEGTVSGLDRAITTESGWFDDMMQTDTAINPATPVAP